MLHCCFEQAVIPRTRLTNCVGANGIPASVHAVPSFLHSHPRHIRFRCGFSRPQIAQRGLFDKINKAPLRRTCRQSCICSFDPPTDRSKGVRDLDDLTLSKAIALTGAPLRSARNHTMHLQPQPFNKLEQCRKKRDRRLHWERVEKNAGPNAIGIRLPLERSPG